MTLYSATLFCDGGCGASITGDPSQRFWITAGANFVEARKLGWGSKFADTENRHPLWLCPKCVKLFTAAKPTAPEGVKA